MSVADFRPFFEVAKPLVIKDRSHTTDLDDATSTTPELPALTKWFAASPLGQGSVLAPYLKQFSSLELPCELVYHPVVESSDEATSNIPEFLSWLSASEEALHKQMAVLLKGHISSLPPVQNLNTQFLQFEAPLELIMAGLLFNQQLPHAQPVQQLYVAQASLSELPRELQEDVPTPELVKKAGKGDVYNSSIWLGLEPTYTPFHRDPNPNIFVQMCSSKVVRLLPPRRGEQIFLQAQARLGQTGNSRIRGPEMMQGAERQVLLDAIWGAEAPDDVQEALVNPRDMLFIPKGWWHSVKSVDSKGGLNASVNWWFR
ncbi:hypothetical protein B0T22DRAFT_386259 [Podospora appendiculata]|uniref:JmjC domain-containing protein n=1 Tax=Podospora appendiculata TaxID=314037 RepID=A0AAE0X1C8_9PEZI|nr:hypothetical protein B0T22DRAFT_386259 [Podospora appendiculata]